MIRRMATMIQIGIFALLPAGAALAQGSGTSGSAGAMQNAPNAMPTDDTRSPAQTKANQLDEQAPATTTTTTTTKHKRMKKTTTTPSISDDKSMSDADRKSDVDGLPDATMNHKQDSKGDLGGKDQLDSDK